MDLEAELAGGKTDTTGHIQNLTRMTSLFVFFFFLIGKSVKPNYPKSLSGASKRHLQKYKIMLPIMMLKYGTIVFMKRMNYRKTKTLLFPCIYFHPNFFSEAPVWTMNHWILGIVGKKYSYELMMPSAFSQTASFSQLFSWFQSNNGTYSYLKKKTKSIQVTIPEQTMDFSFKNQKCTWVCIHVGTLSTIS